jgi:hypothetical protein
MRGGIILHGHTIGHKPTPEYRVWVSMIARCNNKNTINFSRYGGAGLTVCERWMRFENFLADMGPRPQRGTIERIDNTRGYEPDNCRWASYKEQAHNRRGLHKLTINGVAKPMAAWASEAGIPISTVWDRIKRGWSAERALTKADARFKDKSNTC